MVLWVGSAPFFLEAFQKAKQMNKNHVFTRSNPRQKLSFSRILKILHHYNYIVYFQTVVQLYPI